MSPPAAVKSTETPTLSPTLSRPYALNCCFAPAASVAVLGLTTTRVRFGGLLRLVPWSLLEQATAMIRDAMDGRIRRTATRPTARRRCIGTPSHVRENRAGRRRSTRSRTAGGPAGVAEEVRDSPVTLRHRLSTTLL